MEEKEKKGGKRKYIYIALAVIAVIVIIAILFNLGNDKKTQETEVETETQEMENETSESQETDSETETETENETESETPETEDPTETKEETTSQTEPFEIDLTAGNYTVGKDMPAGIYNLTAVNGSGNISSNNSLNGGINEIMANPVDEYSIDSFSNAYFDNGDTLSIRGTLTLHLQSDEADTGSMVARTNPGAAPIDLGSGNFTSGTDFPAGIYTIVATGPSGNVKSSNIYVGGLNEIMSNENNENSISEFKNASLPEGSTLTISGTSVQLIQVGE